MKRTIIALLLILPVMVAAKPTFKITFQVDNSTDTMLLLGYHYGGHTYVCDTAYNTKGKGKFVFEGTQELYPGMYFITNNGSRYVEFVIYHEKPFFTLHTDQSNWMRNMKVKGSMQNQVLFDYHRASNALYDELTKAQHDLDSAAYLEFQQKQYARLENLKLSLIEDHPDAMIGKMIYATREVEVPVEHADGTKMSDRERYDWLMQHYFDYIPLDDDFIVRTHKDFFYRRVMDYVDKYMRGMPPEMIIPLLDTLIDRSEPAPEVYKWLVHTMTDKFLQSPVMVYDEVYVHLAQRYYASGKAYWASTAVIDEQAERAAKWERLLVGRVAPELILFDTLMVPHSLHRMPGRYTLLLFWSPTCGHCRDIIPEIYKVFERVQDSMDMTAFAILTEPDPTTVEKWKKFLHEKNMDSPRWVNLNGGEANVDWREVYDITVTPQIYLIDNKDHKFVAKKLNASMLEQIIRLL